MNIITKQTTTFNLNSKETQTLLELLSAFTKRERDQRFESSAIYIMANNMCNAIKKSLEESK